MACHCLECQRRTGSVFGVGAYYPEGQVAISGVSKQFARPTESGNDFTTHFCPSCGSSVYWSSGKNPGLVGVAVGAFGDASFPQPGRSVWERSMHAWVEIAIAQQHFPKGRV
ncbi:MAG: GFA family protein [Myxococcota bacterium]